MAGPKGRIMPFVAILLANMTEMCGNISCILPLSPVAPRA
jgi:hypothetical protein